MSISSEVEDYVNILARDSTQIYLTEEKLGELFGDKAQALHEEVLGAMNKTIERYDENLSGMISRLTPWVFNQVDIIKYNKGTGIYRTHVDDDGRKEIDRIFSTVLYLNDVVDGGETQFPLQDRVVEPRRGRMVVFPSNYAFPHKACVPESNDKYVLVAWGSGK